jgi:hypothetical protein
VTTKREGWEKSVIVDANGYDEITLVAELPNTLRRFDNQPAICELVQTSEHRPLGQSV